MLGSPRRALRQVNDAALAESSYTRFNSPAFPSAYLALFLPRAVGIDNYVSDSATVAFTMQPMRT